MIKKDRLSRCLINAAAVLLSAQSVAWGAVKIIRVTDECGKPIPQARFTVASLVVSGFWGMYGMRRDTKDCVTDAKGEWRGRIRSDCNSFIEGVSKDGYVFERWLNDPFQGTFSSGNKEDGEVRTIKMRRILDEKSFLLDPLDDREKGYYHKPPYYEFKPGGDVKAVPVDLFYGVDETPNVGGGYVHLVRYDDFLLRPAYDAASGKWEVAFSVTNAGCGIIATTNRVFMAPADGYRAEVAVPQEVLDHPAFTLYLRTREPRLYAMLPFSRSAHHPTRDLGIAFRTALVNPYGGRELERDGRTGKFYNDLREEALRALLVERKYPPRPDIDARMENRKKCDELQNQRRQIGKEERELRREIATLKRKERNLEEAKKLSALQEKLFQFMPRYRKIDKELKRLKEQAHTLNLPDESRKDEEDK